MHSTSNGLGAALFGAPTTAARDTGLAILRIAVGAIFMAHGSADPVVPLGLAGGPRRFHADGLERRVELGILPIPRRDVERLHQVLALQPRLLDLRAPFRAQRGVLHRHVLGEALTWLDIHGQRPEVLEHWRSLQAQPGPGTPVPDADNAGNVAAFRPRRRRRRRGRSRPLSPDPIKE